MEKSAANIPLNKANPVLLPILPSCCFVLRWEIKIWKSREPQAEREAVWTCASWTQTGGILGCTDLTNPTLWPLALCSHGAARLCGHGEKRPLSVTPVLSTVGLLYMGTLQSSKSPVQTRTKTTLNLQQRFEFLNVGATQFPEIIINQLCLSVYDLGRRKWLFGWWQVYQSRIWSYFKQSVSVPNNSNALTFGIKYCFKGTWNGWMECLSSLSDANIQYKS